MKFLSKLFGKGSSGGEGDAETSLPQETSQDAGGPSSAEELTEEELTADPEALASDSGFDPGPSLAAVDPEPTPEAPVGMVAPEPPVEVPEPLVEVPEPSVEAVEPSTGSLDSEPSAADFESADEWSLLRRQLQADPDSVEHHDTVKRAIPLIADRIDFYQELAERYPDVPQHARSLARALQGARRSGEAIPHFQRYLRIHSDAAVFEELAEAYEQAGQSYMATSARQIAQSVRSQGDPCSNS